MENFFIGILFLLSSTRAQYHYKRPQSSNSAYNLRPSYPQNYPLIYQNVQTTRGSVRGSLLSGDASVLPFGSRIIISLIDISLQDAAARRPLNTIVLHGTYRFPISFEIPYSLTQIQSNNNFHQYAIQARIEKDGQLLYINDQYTPVRLIPPSTNFINVFMKKIVSSPGHVGIYTTQAPTTNNRYICLQNPEIGPCKAIIEQYYFNAQIASCQIFYWGGCGGNGNRFNSLGECQRTCVVN